MRHAQEFWRLAYIIYKQPLYMQRLKIDGNRGPGTSLRKGFLEVFDDSDMGQVHDLIMRFQDLSFGEEDLTTTELQVSDYAGSNHV
jgi:hypothetical protein